MVHQVKIQSPLIYIRCHDIRSRQIQPYNACTRKLKLKFDHHHHSNSMNTLLLLWIYIFIFRSPSWATIIRTTTIISDDLFGQSCWSKCHLSDSKRAVVFWVERMFWPDTTRRSFWLLFSVAKTKDNWSRWLNLFCPSNSFIQLPFHSFSISTYFHSVSSVTGDYPNMHWKAFTIYLHKINTSFHVIFT